MMELALQNQKFKVVHELIKIKEGTKIHKEYFYHILEKNKRNL